MTLYSPRCGVDVTPTVWSCLEQNKMAAASRFAKISVLKTMQFPKQRKV